MFTRMDLSAGIRAIAAASFAGAVLLMGTVPALAQDARPDARVDARTDVRWQPWLGCWESTAAPATGTSSSSTAAVICVLPATEKSAVSIATVVDREIVSRTLMDITGTRQAIDQDGCTGWEAAEWSPEGQRVYLRSEAVCPGELEHHSSGVFSITAAGEWLDVQGVAVGGNHGVHVARYRAVTDPSLLPAEVKASGLGGRLPAASVARLAASTPLTTMNVIDAARSLDAPVLETWLAELGQGFGIDARQLTALAEAGVAASTIDLMVALSYPEHFAIDAATGSAEFQEMGESARRGADLYGGRYGLDGYRGRATFGYLPYGFRYGLSSGYPGYGYGSGYGYGYGYGSGYGWYPGGRPIIVVRHPRDEQGRDAARRGRVVNGRGYTQDDSTRGDGPARVRRNTGVESTRSPSAGNSGSRPAGASSSGNSSDTKRTAKPRTSGGT